MTPCDATFNENSVPLGQGEFREFGSDNQPTPALHDHCRVAPTPQKKGIFSGDFWSF